MYFKKPRKNGHLLFFIIFFFLLIIPGCNEEKGSSPSIDPKSRNIPVFPKAQNIKTFTMKNGNIQGLRYTVNERYPAKEVLKFYETKMKKLKFNPFVEECYKNSDRKWQRFIDGTKENEPYVAQLTADWVNSSKTKRIKLILNYYWENYDGSSKIVLSNNENLFVTVQIMPFYTLPPQGNGVAR